MCAWLKGPEGSSLSCVPKVGHSSTRHVSPCASQHTEHQHKFSLFYLSYVTVALFSEPRPVVHASIYPRQDGTSTEFHSSTGYEPKRYEPKRIELNRILVNPQNQMIDDQDEEIGVKTLSCSQSLVQSAYDSAESIATPPTRTSKTSNYVRCWLHCFYGNERKMKGKHELITLNEKAW